MSGGIPFHATRMGQRFYEATLPELVREMKRLNQNLERLIELADPADGDNPPLRTEGEERR